MADKLFKENIEEKIIEMSFSEAQKKYNLITLDSFFKNFKIDDTGYSKVNIDTSGLEFSYHINNDYDYEKVVGKVIEDVYCRMDDFCQLGYITDDNKLIPLSVFIENELDTILTVDEVKDALKDEQKSFVYAEIEIEVQVDVDDFKTEWRNCDIEVNGSCDYLKYITDIMETNQNSISSFYKEANQTSIKNFLSSNKTVKTIEPEKAV